MLRLLEGSFWQILELHFAMDRDTPMGGSIKFATRKFTLRDGSRHAYGMQNQHFAFWILHLAMVRDTPAGGSREYFRNGGVYTSRWIATHFDTWQALPSSMKGLQFGLGPVHLRLRLEPRAFRIRLRKGRAGLLREDPRYHEQIL